MAETRESLSKRIAKIKERKKNHPYYPQAAINKELKLLEDKLAKLPPSLKVKAKPQTSVKVDKVKSQPTRQQVLKKRKSVDTSKSKSSFKPRVTPPPVNLKTTPKADVEVDKVKSNIKNIKLKKHMQDVLKKIVVVKNKKINKKPVSIKTKEIKPVSIKTKPKKGPARTVYDAQDRGLDTFINKKGKVLAAITKEQLAKSGKGLTALLNAQKKSGKSLTKYLESEGIRKSKSTTKKMGGGKVYRRGGGKALRGFGKATYSNKPY